MPRTRSTILAAAVVPLAIATWAVADASSSGSAAANAPAMPVTINPANFVARVDNPWFPLKPGSSYHYRGTRDGKHAFEVLTVTHQTRKILGVPTVVISDRLYLNGKLAERTTDWYTQDRQGNVWYFGENTAKLNAKGQVISRDGSFQAGVDGAQAGIFMPAHLKLGASYAQERYKGHAEDHFTIVDLSAHVKVPYISSSPALRTTEHTSLEPTVLDNKYYVRGIGTVRELQVKGSGSEHLDLVSFKRG
jgi:hypothetical protein